MITYETKVIVRLNGKIVGHIEQAPGIKFGWRYKPNNAVYGDTFSTIEQVKASLKEA